MVIKMFIVKYFVVEKNGKKLIPSSVFIRCSYHYDAFGNLYTKNCTDGSHQYLIDPFGPFGSDVIGEVSFTLQQYYAMVL